MFFLPHETGTDRISLRGTRIVVGRAEPSNEVHIALTDSTVSRSHAELLAVPDGWLLRDLGSTNGTAVDGHRLEVGEAVALTAGQGIVFGEASVVVRVE